MSTHYRSGPRYLSAERRAAAARLGLAYRWGDAATIERARADHAALIVRDAIHETRQYLGEDERRALIAELVAR